MTGNYINSMELGPLAHGGSHNRQTPEPKSSLTPESMGASVLPGTPAVEADDSPERLQPLSVSKDDLPANTHQFHTFHGGKSAWFNLGRFSKSVCPQMVAPVVNHPV